MFRATVFCFCSLTYKKNFNHTGFRHCMADFAGFFPGIIYIVLLKYLLKRIYMTDITETIKAKLDEIERNENIRILYACESGSRAWGFASPDSDYDVRFVYVRPVEFYLKIEKTKDTLECELNETYDISGWDLKKLLWLLNRSNPSIFEWAASPIVYKTTVEWESVRKILGNHFSAVKALYHYNSITKNNLRRYFDGRNEVKYKPYLYNLRQCLACQWIMDKKSPPPIVFDALKKACLPQELEETVDKMLALNKNKEEKDTGSRIREIDTYIEEIVSKVEEYLETQKERRESDWEELNGVFRSVISKAFPDTRP